MTNDELLEVFLPKWPQMIVTGDPVSKAKASEIIRRTDSFFLCHGGNNRKFIEEAERVLRMPVYHEGALDAIERFDEETRAWEKKWGFIRTYYVTNSWISSAYVGGPCGWCHPDGSIGFSDNIGKWPRATDVYEEWRTLAQAFPFLALEVTLMDGEFSEEHTKPAVSMLIRDGFVKLVDPSQRDLHREFCRKIPRPCGERPLFSLLSRSENAISMKELQKWSEQIFGK